MKAINNHIIYFNFITFFVLKQIKQTDITHILSPYLKNSMSTNMKEEYVVIEELLVPCNVKTNKNGLPTCFMNKYCRKKESIQPLDDL